MTDQNTQHQNNFTTNKSYLSKKDLFVRCVLFGLFIAIIFPSTTRSFTNTSVRFFTMTEQVNDSTTQTNEKEESDESVSTQTTTNIDIYDTLKVNESSFKFDSSTITIVKPDSNELAKLKSDEDLQYRKSGDPNPTNSFWNVLLEWLFSKLGSWTYSESGSLFVDVLYYGLIIGLCIAVVYFLSKSNFNAILKGTPKQIELPFEEFSEDIHEVDIEQLINKYVAEKDYRRAVRYLYLQVLKSLTDARFIEWMPSKTNATYSRELGANRKELTNDFIQLTRIFNYAWYGNYPLSESDFPSVSSSFSLFQERLKVVKSKPSDSPSANSQSNRAESKAHQTTEGVQQ
jgi:hypothetical protein